MEILDEKVLMALVDSIESEQLVFERVRPHNRGEIRTSDSMSKKSFKEMISLAIEEGHQPGGDLELKIPSLCKTLVGHHDGIYWLE